MAKWEVWRSANGMPVIERDGVVAVNDEQVADIARKLNAFDEMEILLRDAQAVIDSIGPSDLADRIALAVAEAEATNV